MAASLLWHTFITGLILRKYEYTERRDMANLYTARGEAMLTILTLNGKYKKAITEQTKGMMDLGHDRDEKKGLESSGVFMFKKDCDVMRCGPRRA